MLTKMGTATDLRDLFYQYMDFLTIPTAYGDKIPSWTIIDPRLDSFYGATLVVPTDDYKVKDESVTKVLYDENVIYNIRSSFYDSQDSFNGYTSEIDLFKFLQYGFPNASVELLPRIDSSVGVTPVEDLYAYLQNTPSVELPDVVLCGGLITSIVSNSNNWDSYIDIQLNNLFTFCNNNNIKLYCYVIPTHTQVSLYDSLYNHIESFISETGERIINLPSIFVDMFGSLQALYTTFNNYPYSCSYYGALIRRLMQEFMGLDRPEYYVSFQFRNITANSYKEFLYNYDDYQSEEFDKTENGYYDHERQMMVERKIASKDDAKNPFRYNGQIVAVGLHTSYDHRLWMCEQGGITCKKEADEQINDIDLLPFWQFWYGFPQKRRDIPVYPSTGCPWMTIANTDISKYGVNSTNNPINFYFTKDNLGSTITIRVCDSNYTYPDCWQNIVFGRFTNTKDVIYPLYVGGGSLPLYPDWWLYYATSHTYGQMYNLSMKNPALANSNILHTTKFGKANLSNFRVMSPDGFWRDIYSAYQTYKDIQYFTLAGVVYEWGECVLPHTYNYTFNTGAELVDTRGKIGLLDIQKDSDNINRAYDEYFEKASLDEIAVQLNDSNEDNTNLSRGTIPRVYASWSRDLEQGLHSSNGKYWLAIPNGWQDRLWHYKFYYGRIYWEGKNEKSEWNITPRGLEQLEYVRDEYHTLTEGRYNQKMINDKLVVDFGKAPVEVPELEIEFPQDYIQSTDAGLVLKCLVHAEADEIKFSLYVRVNAVVVDFGDSSVEKFKYGDKISHLYTSTGDFYIKFYVVSANNYYHCLENICNEVGTGLCYVDSRRKDVLKEFYVSPYYPDAIFVNDIGPHDMNIGIITEDSGTGWIINNLFVYKQHGLEKLYLPYLAKKNIKYSGGIKNIDLYTYLSIVDCKNLSDIYVYKDYVNDYSTIRDNNNTVRLFISDYIEEIDVTPVNNREISIYIDSGFSNVFINCIDSCPRGSNNIVVATLNKWVNDPDYSIGTWRSLAPIVHLYLYGSSVVNVNKHYGYTEDMVGGSRYNMGMNGIKFYLHVPSNLYNDYVDIYDGYASILGIYGDIV